MNDKTTHSDGPKAIIEKLVQEGMVAKSSYQIWSALRIKEFFDRYEEILTDDNFYAFFSTSSAAHLKVIFISINKMFDSGRGPASIENLRKVLKDVNRHDLVTYIDEKLGIQTEIPEITERIKMIRNQSIAHNQKNMSKKEIYEQNPVTPDELCCVINETCEVINHIALEFNLSTMFMDDKIQQSTLKVLDALQAA